MTDTTGHWLDTGDGPVPLTASMGMALESRERVAYRAYLDHRPRCKQCQNSLHICPAATSLWEAYKAAGDDEE